ncbi:MAG: hypothetical protein D6750_01695 [Bacteroidetes bacterium]|nr:MAG: hypothetical protein D6750_01695 [Bacteroidota bacterium]
MSDSVSDSVSDRDLSPLVAEVQIKRRFIIAGNLSLRGRLLAKEGQRITRGDLIAIDFDAEQERKLRQEIAELRKRLEDLAPEPVDLRSSVGDSSVVDLDRLNQREEELQGLDIPEEIRNKELEAIAAERLAIELEAKSRQAELETTRRQAEAKAYRQYLRERSRLESRLRLLLSQTKTTQKLIRSFFSGTIKRVTLRQEGQMLRYELVVIL